MKFTVLYNIIVHVVGEWVFSANIVRVHLQRLQNFIVYGFTRSAGR